MEDKPVRPGCSVEEPTTTRFSRDAILMEVGGGDGTIKLIDKTPMSGEQEGCFAQEPP